MWKAFTEFCTDWADVFSVLGFLLALIGFGITIIGVRKAKKAAVSANEAAQEAKERIQKQSTFANASAAISVMDSLVGLIRSKQWENTLDRHTVARRLLVELKDGGGGLSEKQQIEIQSTVEQLKIIENQIEKHLSGNKTEPKVHLAVGVIKDQIDKIHSISVELKHR
jgi:hypothetical protein